MKSEANLTQVLTELLLHANWNSTLEGHITKVAVFADLDELGAQIERDLRKTENEGQYMRGMRSAADQLDRFGTTAISQELHDLLNKLDFRQEGIHFNVLNYNYLHRTGLTRFLPGFDTAFRGDIKTHWPVPFTRGDRIIFLSDQHKFYVGRLQERGTALSGVESVTFDTFDQAAAFCLNPNLFRAIALLAAGE